jgi:Leucine-rich repeat (LRR) protein
MSLPDYQTDLNNVQALLNANGLSNIRAEDVSSANNISGFTVGLARVQKVNLSGQNLSRLVIPDAFYKVDALTSINLARNYLTGVPDGLKNFAYLNSIDLTGNQICPTMQTLWWDSFASGWRTKQYCASSPGYADYQKDSAAVRAILDSNGLSNIRVRDVTSIDSNRIRKIDWAPLHMGFTLSVLPPDIAKLTELTILRLTFQRIKRLPDEICSMKSLTELAVSESLETIPDSIGNLVNLGALYVSSKIKAIPQSLAQLYSLRSLNLTGDHFDTIPQSIFALTNLTSLIMTSTGLYSVPSQIGGLSELNLLYLDHNNLSTLPIEITNLIKLNDLDLAQNKLCSLPAEIATWAGTFEPGWSLYQHCP